MSYRTLSRNVVRTGRSGLAMLALTLAGLLAMPYYGFAQHDETEAEARRRIEQEKEDALRVSATEIPEEIEEFEVDGLKVILRPTGPGYHTVAARLYIRGGLPALPAGLSPAVEQLALDVPRFSGPANIDRAQFRREIDRMRTGIGATAERDFSTISLRCVDENFDRSWEFFTGVIMNPSLDPTEMANIKERTITAIRNRKVVPEAYAEYLADSVFFYNHPYGRISKEEEVAPINEKMLRDYHKQMYVKSRLFLVVVGNLTREEITAKVRSTLAKLPKGSYKDPKIPIPENATKPSVLIRKAWGREDIPTNYLVARHLGPRRDDDLFYAMQRLRSYVGGFLFREIRIERNLSYAPDASTYDHRLGFGDISISTVLPDSAWRVTKGNIISFFQDNILTEETLANIPATWYTSQYMDQQTAESQATEIGAAYFYTGDWRTAYQTLERFSEVTPEELNEAAAKYLQNFTVVVVGNPENVNAAEYLPDDGLGARNESSAPSARSGGKSSRFSNNKSE